MATSEHEIQKEILVALSAHKCFVQRINVGKGFMIRYSQIIKQLPNGN